MQLREEIQVSQAEEGNRNGECAPLSAEERAEKRRREMRTVRSMIAIYCRAQHGTRRGELCAECRELSDYVDARIERCPVIDTKTFCSSCEVHCYSPAKRTKIREVMRFAGPRMLFYDPIGALRHVADTLRAKRQRKVRAR